MSLWGLWVFLILLGGALLIFLWYSRNATERRERAIISSRSSDTLEHFMGSFRPETQAIANALYCEFQKFTFSGKFPFRKSDRIAQMLGIDRLDLDEALTAVANRFGCRKPTKEDEGSFPRRETLEDYVEFLHHLRAI